MPVVASIKTCVQSLFSMPLKVLGVNILIMLFVPALAKLAGNHDPDANAISHVFGQETICVAMDFPGWREAANVIFFLSGISGGYAVYTIYLHCKTVWGGKQFGLFIYTLWVIILMNLLWMVGLFDVVTYHNFGTVLAHTLPYVGIQVAFLSFIGFILLCLRPTDCGKCQQVFWYITTVGYLLLQLFLLGVVIYTFIDYSQSPNRSETGENHYRGIMNRHSQFFSILEPASLAFRWFSLMLHPLKLDTKPTGEPDKEGKPEVDV
mmetsp:Transcript_121527/g.170985  ORF Transcript_121527/g.170985 Transcript_121527/m.170985 type:complete len:264 (-) Transcript_121527:165-956(-)